MGDLELKDNWASNVFRDQPELNKFRWDDPLLLEESLKENERMLMDGAKAFAEEKLMPNVIDAYDNQQYNPNLFKEMGEMGLFGLTLPEEFGGINSSFCFI